MSEELHWDNSKVNENLLAENKALKRFISRGGFVQDSNYKWCKEGDLVAFTCGSYRASDEEMLHGRLCWEGDIGQFYISDGEDSEEPVSYLNEVYFELVTPCEPDVCKDFEEVEK